MKLHQTEDGCQAVCVSVCFVWLRSSAVVSSHVSLLDTDDSAGKSLQLSSGQILHVSFPQVSQIYATIADGVNAGMFSALIFVQPLKHFRMWTAEDASLSKLFLPSCWQMMSCVSVSSFLVRMAPTDPWRLRWVITACRATATNHHTQLVYLDRLWDLVNILRFDDSPQVILQNFSEVVLQLGTSEVGQDLLPIWRTLEHSLVFLCINSSKNQIFACNLSTRAVQEHGWLAPVILTSYLPRLGFCFPARIFRAVDLPIPLVPTSPSTPPGRGIGSLDVHA